MYKSLHIYNSALFKSLKIYNSALCKSLKIYKSALCKSLKIFKSVLYKSLKRCIYSPASHSLREKSIFLLIESYTIFFYRI